MIFSYHPDGHINLNGFVCSLEEFVACNPKFKLPKEATHFIYNESGLIHFQEDASSFVEKTWKEGDSYLKNQAKIIQQINQARSTQTVELNNSEILTEGISEEQQAFIDQEVAMKALAKEYQEKERANAEQHRLLEAEAKLKAEQNSEAAAEEEVKSNTQQTPAPDVDADKPV